MEKFFTDLWKKLPPGEREALVGKVVAEEASKINASDVGDFLWDQLWDKLQGTLQNVIAQGFAPGFFDRLWQQAQQNELNSPELYAALAIIGAVGGIYTSWSEGDTVSAFIMNVHLIKVKKFGK